MELTLKNYKTELPADLLLKAKKGTVRECDEIEKGHFQAYVDENNQTFDTYLMVNNKGEITDHGCDCLSTTSFCHHQTALLLFVLKGKKTVSKLKVGKKANTIETLVNEADPEKLKTWLITLLTENKDLGIKFSYQFSQSNRQYQPHEIKQLSFDAVKAVIKTKRSVDTTQSKKIIELWSVLHETFIDEFCTQIADQESFLRLHAVMEACEEVRAKYGDFSGRLTKYQDNLLLKVMPAVHQLHDEDTWDHVVSYFTDRIHGTPYYLRTFYLTFLVKLHQLSSMDRKRRLAVVLVAQFMTVNPRQFYDGTKYIITVFNLVNESGLFQDYYLLFQPIRYQNAYNIELIELLIEHGIYELAEKYCLDQISGNSREEYNIDYLAFLIDIYTVEGDDKKLAGVLKELLPYSFEFKTYLFVAGQMEEGEEKAKWRNLLLARARREASYHAKAMHFSFQLLDYEQNYSKMLAYLDSSATYEVIVQFAEKMASMNKEVFLKEMIFRTDNIKDVNDQNLERLQPLFDELFNVLSRRCSPNELQLILQEFYKKARYHLPNKFVVYLNNRLSAG